MSQDDYGTLLDGLRSPDSETRISALRIARTLSSDEQQEFFNFQKKANANVDVEQRPDAAVVGGVPGIGSISPEAIALGGAGLMRGGVPGTGIGAQAVARAKSALSTAAPYVKYQATKGILRSIGFNEAIADPIAWMVAGYRNGRPPSVVPPGAAQAEASAPVAAAATPRVVLTPSEAAMQDQVGRLAQQEAARRGMLYAAGQKP
jgi:hypothetical protein